MAPSKPPEEGGGAPGPEVASTSAARRPAVVTIAALYGAGGSVIGSRVAELLGVPFLDRAIPQEVARRSGLSEGAIGEADEQPRSFEQRLFARIGRASTITGETGGRMERLDFEHRDLRAKVEDFLARASISGGVALGRGGMVVLRTVPWALHVHLGGPREARIRQAMTAEGIDRQVAEHRQKREDRARIDYVSSAYGVDGSDPLLYHLMVDSTALDLDVCIDLIVTASRARSRDPRPSAPI
jgi:cytidylate kinase